KSRRKMKRSFSRHEWRKSSKTGVTPMFALAPQTGGSAMTNGNQSLVIEGWIRRLKHGDDQPRKRLLHSACQRLTGLTRTMLKGFGRAKRWDETDDVVQDALHRLYRTLEQLQPASAVEFYRLAALIIRRELLDLAKHYSEPRGLGANYASVDTGSHKTLSGPGYRQPGEADEPGPLQ